jgi:hypothetical protein
MKGVADGPFWLKRIVCLETRAEIESDGRLDKRRVSDEGLP